MPRPKKIKKTISMSEDTAERLMALADARHTTISQLITNWTWQTSISPKYNDPIISPPKTFDQDDDLGFH